MKQGFEDAAAPGDFYPPSGTRLEGYVERVGDGMVDAVFASERDGPLWHASFPVGRLGEGAEFGPGSYLDAEIADGDLDVRLADVGMWTQEELDEAQAKAALWLREIEWDEDAVGQ